MENPLKQQAVGDEYTMTNDTQRDDIVERLRGKGRSPYLVVLKDVQEAADLIEKQRAEIEERENDNAYNAMLQLGMVQLLKEAGVWPKSGDIIAAYDRYQSETEERLSRAVIDEKPAQ